MAGELDIQAARRPDKVFVTDATTSYTFSQRVGGSFLCPYPGDAKGLRQRVATCPARRIPRRWSGSAR
jgi:hypothetical protein